MCVCCGVCGVLFFVCVCVHVVLGVGVVCVHVVLCVVLPSESEVEQHELTPTVLELVSSSHHEYSWRRVEVRVHRVRTERQSLSQHCQRGTFAKARVTGT